MVAKEGETRDGEMLEHGSLLNGLPSLCGMTIQAADTFRERTVRKLPSSLCMARCGRAENCGPEEKEQEGPVSSLDGPQVAPP
jgi:hypothetical protein